MQATQRDDRTGPVAGVILAAGASRRMGRNKLLLDLDGQSVVQRAVRTALDAGLDPVLVVVGRQDQSVRAELVAFDCRFVFNPGHEAGMNSSVQAGIAAVPPGCSAAVVLLADMPLVDAQMIGALVGRYRDTDAPMLVSAYGEGDGRVVAPPTLYDRSLFAELAGEEGRGCARRMQRRHAGQTLEVAWPRERLSDLDVPEDYERLKSALRSGVVPSAAA
jgi:molybdenum cofactor cytidylyltransferase